MLDVELFLKVLNKSILSPWFAILVPLVLLAQRFPSDSTAVQLSLIYTALTVLSSLIPHLITVALSPRPLKYLISPPRISWADQIVLVTGGAGGIGSILVETLALRGVTVVVLDVKERVTFQSGNVAYYQCDIANKAEVDRVAERIREEIGDPTMLVNNAGIVQGKKILDLTEEEITESVGVNYVSHFWIVKAFLPAMLKAKRGHILTVASVLGIVGCARLTDYCSTKAAIIQFQEALRFELDTQYDGREIYTTLLLPSFVQGPLFASATLPDSVFFRFFSPALEPHEIAKQMIERLSVEQNGLIMMPSYVRFVPFMRWIPGLREICQKLSKADYAMDQFVRPGKKVA